MRNKLNHTVYRKATRGFTLIELLVVIAIIALLLSIILPSLKRAKELAQRISCSSNLKQLTIAWRMYADDYDGKVVPCRAVQNYPDQAWTGWNYFDYDVQTQESRIREGLLFNYAESVGAYKCPTSKKGEGLRTYCMACVWNPPVANLPGSGFEVFTKLSDVKNLGVRNVFVDNVGVDYDAMFTVPYGIPEWRNIPNWRHNNGTTVSFGDGHVEYWKWTNLDLTVEVARRSYELSMLNKTIARMVNQGDQSNNDDLKRVQKATWGTTGY